MERTLEHAYFENEQGATVPPSPPPFPNRFKAPGPDRVNVHQNLLNFLDPGVRTQQRQPQTIPTALQGMSSRYDLFVGAKTMKKTRDAPTTQRLKISLLFGVEQDLDNLGLRFFFEQVEDRVLINVPGREPENGTPRWNIGISGLSDASRGIGEDQIAKLMALAGLARVPYKLSVLAAYSTGYGGLNQSVNEGLLPLQDIETVVYYDCTYRADGPPAAAGDPRPALNPAEINPGADEIDAGHATSAFNGRRALSRIAAAASNPPSVVAYMATSAGSPHYLKKTIAGPAAQYTLYVPTAIDLRAFTPGSPVQFEQALFALALARCLAYAAKDGQISAAEHASVPALKDLALSGSVPPRGSVASTTATLKAKPGFAPLTTLLDWGKTNKTQVLAANGERVKAVRLVSGHKLMYPQGYPAPGNEAGVLHASLLPEFGWEFLL